MFITKKKKKAPLCSTPGHLGDPSTRAPVRGWSGPHGRPQGQAGSSRGISGGGGSGPGQHSFPAAQVKSEGGERCSWRDPFSRRRSQWLGAGTGKGRRRRDPKGVLTCCLPRNSGKRTAHGPLGLHSLQDSPHPHSPPRTGLWAQPELQVLSSSANALSLPPSTSFFNAHASNPTRLW